MNEDALKELLSSGAAWSDGSDFWKALIKLCQEQRVKDDADYVRVTSEFEAAYKRLIRSTAKMPIKYRSAKSIVGSAIRLGVPYIDTEGKPRGKSAVQNDVKHR